MAATTTKKSTPKKSTSTSSVAVKAPSVKKASPPKEDPAKVAAPAGQPAKKKATPVVAPAAAPGPMPAPAAGGGTSQTTITVEPLPPSDVVDINEPRKTENFQPKNSYGNVNSFKANAVMAFLFALIVVNGFSSGQFQSIWKVLTKQSTDTTTSHHSFLILGGEIVFAIGMSLIAETGDSASNVIGVFVFALWLLWGVKNFNHINNFAKKVNG